MTDEKQKTESTSLVIFNLKDEDILKLTELKEKSLGIQIKTEADVQSAAELLILIKSSKKFVNSQFDPEDEKLKDGYDKYVQVRARRKSYIELLDSMDQHVRFENGEYFAKKEKDMKAEEERLRKIDDERKKKEEAERLKKIEEAKKTGVIVEDFLPEPDPIIDVPVEKVVPSARSKVVTMGGSTGTYKERGIKITDIKKVLREAAKGTIPLNSVKLIESVIKKYMNDLPDLEVNGIERIEEFKTKVY